MSQPSTTRALNVIFDDLAHELESLRFSLPVTHVYNPLLYARQPLSLFLERFASMGAENLLLGMNPGPWGMAQTGVPFGAVAPARDWLRVEAPVGRPAGEHPKRPISGYACPRNEVSGERLWGWAAATFGTPEAFFSTFFVHNFCPLIFLEESGRNLTPDKIKAAERKPLLEPCHRALGRVIKVLGPRRVIGVGVWATKMVRTMLDSGYDGVMPEVGTILHPSPANPHANRGWAGKVNAQLKELGIELPAGEYNAQVRGQGESLGNNAAKKKSSKP